MTERSLSRLTVVPAGPASQHRLAISLWDFSWYTQAGPGEPFADIDAAFAQAAERGFNTVRICAAPFLLFSGRVAPQEWTVTGLGGQFGQRTRWYNVRGGYRLNLLSRLEDLLTAARRHGFFVIISSWEYQQSASLVASSVWHDALAAVPGHERALVMANSLIAMLNHLSNIGLDDRIAYVELHNEVDNCALLPRSPDDPPGHYARLRDSLDAAVRLLRSAHPAVPITYSLGETWPLEFANLPDSGQVAHFHAYVYGVLGALYQAVGLGHGTEPGPSADSWPSEELKAMLLPEAPALAQYQPAEPWKLAATGIPDKLFYVHDWVDPDKWDLWLYEHYQEHRLAMRQRLAEWIDAIAALATARRVPAVLGEGVVGYTPRLSAFEDDAVGKDLAELVVDQCLRQGFWGMVLTSNAAPHHPMWHTQAAWMRRLNARITGFAPVDLTRR
jgi:hypothetical protein